MWRRISLVVPLVALMCWVAPASAAPVDTHSAHLGLHAYRAYLSSLVSRVDDAAKSDDALIRTVRTSCPNVLAPVAKAKHPNDDATSQFGSEVGADLVIASFAPDQKPLTTLTERVGRLKWSSDRTGAHLSKALAGMEAFLQFAPSDICADAKALADSGGQSVSPATDSFVLAFDHVSNAADLGPLTRTFNRYRSASDRAFVRKLDRLSSRLELRLFDVVGNRAFTLLDALGLDA